MRWDYKPTAFFAAFFLGPSSVSVTIAEAVMVAPSAMLEPLLAPAFMARLADANTDARNADLHALRH